MTTLTRPEQLKLLASIKKEARNVLDTKNKYGYPGYISDANYLASIVEHELAQKYDELNDVTRKHFCDRWERMVATFQSIRNYSFDPESEVIVEKLVGLIKQVLEPEPSLEAEPAKKAKAK